MDRNRRRVAIGVFATLGDAESVVVRLTALGITHFERLPASANQAAANPDREASDQSLGVSSQSYSPSSSAVSLRIYLHTPDEEQLVAATLLASAARSVLLHDIDPPA